MVTDEGPGCDFRVGSATAVVVELESARTRVSSCGQGLNPSGECGRVASHEQPRRSVERFTACTKGSPDMADAQTSHYAECYASQTTRSRLTATGTCRRCATPRTFRYRTCPRRPAVSVLIIFRSRVNSSVLSRGISFAQASLQYVGALGGPEHRQRVRHVAVALQAHLPGGAEQDIGFAFVNDYF